MFTTDCRTLEKGSVVAVFCLYGEKKLLFLSEYVTFLTEHSNSQRYHVLVYTSLCSFHRTFWLFCSLISSFS